MHKLLEASQYFQLMNMTVFSTRLYFLSGKYMFQIQSSWFELVSSNQAATRLIKISGRV